MSQFTIIGGARTGMFAWDPQAGWVRPEFTWLTGMCLVM